jgi:autotransporter adhesin
MIKNHHLKLSVLTLALTVSSAAIADINLGTDINHITVNVNSDDGNIGDFIVLNGTNSQIENFRSNRHFTSITTSNGNKFTLDNNGAHLSNITLSGVADGVNNSDAVNVSQLNSVKGDLTALTNNVTAIGTRLDTAEDDLTNLRTDLTSETAARTAADATLQNNIDAETAARTAADTTLQNNINAEAATRAAADVVLQNNINTEAATRAAADTTLQNNINAEAATRAAADVVLQNNINTEAATRAAADVVLQNNINIETAERIAGDRATLASANAYTDQSFAKIEKRYQAAVAASIAIASLPQPTEAGKSMISFGTGAWESEQGYAMGVSGVTANNKWVYKAAASADNRGKFGGGLSVGLQW